MDEQDLKDQYLELIEDGELPDVAARTLGKTGRWFRKFRSVKSQCYDPVFEAEYERIMRPDGPHRERIIQTARAALIDAAKDGNVRAIEKILMAYDPDFSFLRPAAFVGDTYVVDKLIQIMPGIPTHVLEEMRQQLLEKRELPVLEA